MTTPRFLFCSVALAALVTCLPVSAAHAQYIGYRSDQPNVEIDLSALDDTPTTSRVQPQRPQQRTEDFSPPITSGYTSGNQPPAVPVPRVEAAPKRLAKPLFAVPVNTPAPPPPAPVAAPVQQQRQQRPPAQNIIWDQPTTQKPVVQQKPAAQAPVPAARKPYNPYLSVPPAAKPAPAPQAAPQQPSIDAALQPDARQKMPLPVMVNAPFDVDNLTAVPHRKPEVEPAPQITEQKAPPVKETPVKETTANETLTPVMAETMPVQAPPVTAQPVIAPPVKAAPPVQNPTPRTAGTQAPAVPTPPASTMSYPPSSVQKAPVQYYDRPVLPTAAAETAVKPALPVAPVALPEERITLDADTPVKPPVRKPVIAAPAVPEKNIATVTTVPARKPLQPDTVETLMPDETIPLPEVAVAETEAPIAAPKNIVPVARPSFVTTSAPPPDMRQDAEPQAIFGYPADVQQPPVPFEQIAENMETVPVEVAIAPPKPEYGARVVPSKADLTLEFKGHSEELDTQSQNKLLNIVKLLSEDSDRKLLVRGYASGENGSKTDALDKSLTRVSEVRSFLMEQGVRPTRVMVRALGQETDRKPLDRVDLVFAQQ